MEPTAPLPWSLRTLLQQALDLAEEMRGTQHGDDEDVLTQLLDDLRARVGDALSEARSTPHPRAREVTRSVKVADGILLYLTDPTQRDARGRLRDVAAQLREALG